MSRVIQPTGTRGSLKWIQRAVSHRPDLLQPPLLGAVSWVSPLQDDDLAEYRDGSFLERVGHGDLKGQLAAFWPTRGPQWDALGVLQGNGVLLVEAKAHLAEFKSPPCQAKGASRDKIMTAMEIAKSRLNTDGGADWCQTYYQYANRMAHLWWLCDRGVDAHLAFVSFLNDSDMNGPTIAAEWEAAFREADRALGLPNSHILSSRIHHLFPDVRLLAS